MACWLAQLAALGTLFIGSIGRLGGECQYWLLLTITTVLMVVQVGSRLHKGPMICELPAPKVILLWVMVLKYLSVRCHIY